MLRRHEAPAAVPAQPDALAEVHREIQLADALRRGGRHRRARWSAALTFLRHDPGKLARVLTAMDSSADTPRGR